MQTITVIGTTALPGTSIPIDKLPYSTQMLEASDLTREGTASIISAINDQLGSVNINNNLNDPFQPDILYRGFEASPVLGTPEGLAVYQNGVRINDAFGDNLNWDLFPDLAIDRIDVISSNPVYGLNALGGAVVMSMKNGFTYQGGQAEISGGSWGQRQAGIQYGRNNGAWGIYMAARALEEDGWRQFSPDSLRQLYSALSYRGDRLTIDLGFTGANNRLSGESPTPVQELAIDRALIFTSPQSNTDELEFVTINAGYAATDTLSIQSNFYYREYRQTVVNGNTTHYTACTDPSLAGSMCQSDGATAVRGPNGGFIPDISQGGSLFIGENNFQSLRTVGLGGSVQAAESASLFGHENILTVGAGIDSASTDFQSSAELGTIDPRLRVSFSGLFVSTPENTPFEATPVSLGAASRYYGFYATDTFNVTDDLAVTVSGRYNVAQIDLADRLGDDLTGQNRYSRFNPAVGATYRLSAYTTAYVGYSENNRAPTPSEIECANPTAPCLLPSSLSSDPPTLHQVVSHTWELGLRGNFTLPQLVDGRFIWNASLFRTNLDDDIYAAATSISTGYFQNIGGTRRQGAELGLRYQSDRFSAFANYSYVAATFESTFLLNSPQNLFANTMGDIQITPGDKLPGIPAHRIKLGADYRVTDNWTVGGDVVWESSQFFFGDASNQIKPLPGFAVVNLHSAYDLVDGVQLFVNIVNAFDASYATFGILGDPTGVGAPGVPRNGITNGPGVDNRFESPSAPISAFGGVRVRF
ncbi:MAG TPA: TonB-dependent receptor [Alphaproteobacteria bacterium]|nr:TonB-dependent receptor [Alphaproteobacteria bacterium]